MRLKFITLILVALFAAVSLGIAHAAPFAPFIPGDVDRDGLVEPGDYWLAYLHVTSGLALPQEMIATCDMSSDGKCNRRDLPLIAQAAGIPAKAIKGKK